MAWWMCRRTGPCRCAGSMSAAHGARVPGREIRRCADPAGRRNHTATGSLPRRVARGSLCRVGLPGLVQGEPRARSAQLGRAAHQAAARPRPEAYGPAAARGTTWRPESRPISMGGEERPAPGLSRAVDHVQRAERRARPARERRGHEKKIKLSFPPRLRLGRDRGASDLNLPRSMERGIPITGRSASLSARNYTDIVPPERDIGAAPQPHAWGGAPNLTEGAHQA